ncbi:hypothetical protein SDJN02_27166, partial [Cucurbita argyrosperma subsp. argyrosperma]
MFLVESIPEPRYIKDENLLDKASNLRNLNFKISFSEASTLGWMNNLLKIYVKGLARAFFAALVACSSFYN